MKCNKGYIVNGNNPITCNAAGKFSNVPTCELVVCTEDNWETLNIEHSLIPDNLPVTYLTEVTVQCKDKYSTKSVVKCSENGEFTYTGQKPTCYAGRYCINIGYFDVK